MTYVRHLPTIAAEDARFLAEKDASYGSSWKKRGGVGAFMMLARKWDRFEQILSTLGRYGGGEKDAQPYDIFGWITAQCKSERDYSPLREQGHDGSVLAEIRDLRRYLLLVEAEMVERGVVAAPVKPVIPSDTAYQNIVQGIGGGTGQPTNRLRRQLNHVELMGLPREDQLRYKFVEGEQAYILQPGKVVTLADGSTVFLPEKISKQEMDSMSYAFGGKVYMLEYYSFHHEKQAWYLIGESDRD